MNSTNHISDQYRPDSFLVSVLFLLKFYITLVGCFALAKVIFMLYNFASAPEMTFSEGASVIWHGLPLDMATAGYFTAPIWLVLGIGVWVRVPGWGIGYRIYCACISILIALCLVADTCLYEFWGIKLDGTVFAYMESPEGAMNSVGGEYMLGVVVAFLLVAVGFYVLLSGALFRNKAKKHPCDVSEKKDVRPFPATLMMLLVGGLLFLGIRGGVGKSTANVGMVYHSEKIFLNHSAVNPVFSIISSLFKTKDFADQHNHFDEAERASQFAALQYHTSGTTVDTLLRVQRPNVLLILMEGCSGVFVHAIDSMARPDITPNLNQMANEGVAFTQCYANSFRTDRGTVCTLSGYPAFPDVSVMKVPSKCERLPSIARSLANEGYATEFLYGGDINFTNTNGYLLATGYERTLGDKDFPVEVRRTHNWGVTDHIVLDTLYQRVMRLPTERPWHIACLTLASHEPWKVPYERIPEDKVLNAMAYLDDCLGNFINRLRKTPVWENTLVILLPDHGVNYPQGISDADPRKSHIPMIWTGGAIRQAKRIETLCNQTDLAATLLGQLGVNHSDFTFSRDVTADTYVHPSAVHVWNEGIYYMDESGISVLHLVSQEERVQSESPTPSQNRVNAAHAFLQTAYDDLGKQ